MTTARRLARPVVLFALAMLPAPAKGQVPDHRGEAVTDQPHYRGEVASAPIPAEMHVRNEGGRDGSGLCVIASVLANGMYQAVPGLEGGKDSELWRAAKAAPGGYSPDKLASLVGVKMPTEKYASYVGSGTAADRAFLERLSKAGYPIGATMNTGALYSYRPIHHMISLAHYRQDGWACVVDNNRPGFYSWMPSQEFDRRWPDQGMAWAWVWTRLPEILVEHSYGLAIALGIVAGTVVVLAVARRRAELEEDERERERVLCYTG